MLKYLVVFLLVASTPYVAADGQVKQFDSNKKLGDLYKDLMDENGSINLPALTLPMSEALSPESKQGVLLAKQQLRELLDMWKQSCADIEDAAREDLPAVRQCRAETFYKSSVYKQMIAIT